MDGLIARIRHLKRWAGFSDALLLHLLSESDYVPDRIANGVILFQQSEVVSYWYLLLSGEVELYLPSDRESGFLGQHLFSLSAGALFGELNRFYHCCSARVKRTAEFVRLNQIHFTDLYHKHADHLQPYILAMEDIINDRREELPSTSAYNNLPELPSFSTVPPEPIIQTNGTHHNNYNSYDFSNVQNELPNVPNPLNINIQTDLRPKLDSHWQEPANLFELSNAVSLGARICEAGLLLKRAIHYRAPNLFRDRRALRGDKTEFFPKAATGSEMASWLASVSTQYVNTTSKQPTSLQIIGVWQTLLDNNIISHVTNEEQFKDKMVFYKWTVNDPFDAYLAERNQQSSQHLYHSQFVAMPDLSYPPAPGFEPPSDAELQQAIFLLSSVGLDSMFKIILSKPPHERTDEELALVFDELLQIKALSHLSTIVKKELAKVICFEQHQHVGTVLFHQGDEGKSWYIILKGSVDVSIAGKGVVCNLQEGDDFGKLALVNDAPRAATITLRDENSQFLRVDKENFDKILRDAEANTVRLKEHGQDVLVLEKIQNRFTDQIPRNQCCYSVMAGLPEKMIEYVLETRVDAQTELLGLDTFLEDFILTHIIFMPSNILCNYLKNYYAKRGEMTDISVMESVVESQSHFHKKIIAKRRVITFLSIWEYVLGIHLFLDPVANSFVEEMFCCVVEDARALPNMFPLVEQITKLRLAREKMMRILSRHPAVVLDCGVYTNTAPAPNPILSIDTCNQCIYLPNATMLTLSVRLDKSVTEIVRLIKAKVQFENEEELYLVEVKSNGERVVYSPTEISVPTMISLNGRLYLISKSELDTLTALPNQTAVSKPTFISALDLSSSSDLAAQLANFHSQLFHATDEIELVFQVVGRNKFPGRSPSNLDILLRRFNEVQYWATTEVLLSATPAKRLANVKKLIKTAMHAKNNKDLMTMFAVMLGLSNVAVSRLTQLWDKLPGKIKRQYAEFEAFLDPSRNHRAYRLLVSKMEPPVIPFVPLLLKDLTFMHEGNKTYFGSLVNFEKMHMIANVLRSFRGCKVVGTVMPEYCKKPVNHLLRNFRVIDNQKRLMELSYQIEPPVRSRSRQSNAIP